MNIFPIRVPPLRDRRDDIPILARHFMREFAARMGRPIEQIDAAALDRLLPTTGRGTCASSPTSSNVRSSCARAPSWKLPILACPARCPQPAEEFLTLEEAERRHILKALERTGGVLAGPGGAAAFLGVNRSTLWSRMRKLGIPSS